MTWFPGTEAVRLYQSEICDGTLTFVSQGEGSKVTEGVVGQEQCSSASVRCQDRVRHVFYSLVLEKFFIK